MTRLHIPYKTIYTALLVVIYAAFFVVHCYFKMSLGAFNSRYADVTLVSQKQAASKKDAGFSKTTKQGDRKNNRLNKRFHPESSYLVAKEILYTPLVYSAKQKTPTFYTNPTQARICINKTLRGPPPTVV